jgi:hypothetical protein
MAEGGRMDMIELAGIIASTTAVTGVGLRAKAPVFYTYDNQRREAHNLRYKYQKKKEGWDPDVAGSIADWRRPKIEGGYAKSIAKETGVPEDVIRIFNTAKPKATAIGVRVPTGIIPNGFTTGMQHGHIRPSINVTTEGQRPAAGREVAVQIGCLHAAAEAKLLEVHLELSQKKLAYEGLLTRKRAGTGEEPVECDICINNVMFLQNGIDGEKACFQCKPPDSNRETRTTALGQIRWHE